MQVKTTDQTYNPSFLEKLLGRNYKWWYLFKYGISLNTVYMLSDAFWFAGRLVFILSIIFVYYKLDTQDILEQVLFTNLFSSFLSFILAYDVNEDIKTGNIGKLLILPSDIFKFYLFRSLGISLRGITFNVTIFLITIILFGFKINLFYLIVTILLTMFFSIFLKFLTDFLIGLITFWLIDGYGLINFYLSLFAILNGSLIPFVYMNNLIKFNPFAFVAYHPMQIYLGNYDLQQTLLVFLGGIAWCIVLYLLAKLVFKAGLKRNESVGL